MPVSTSSVLKFAKLSDKAFTPVKGNAYAAGYDLKRWVFLLLIIN